MQHDSEFRSLLSVSARLGRDPLRTQAAGGNTSLKRDGTMWIKASGTWLADAETRPIMVPVRLDPLLTALRAGDRETDDAVNFVTGDYTGGLRPSVETAVHAVIHFPVVIHIHCVATIALSVRTDAESVIKDRLAGIPGIDWAFVPYVKPGMTLAQALDSRLRPTTNVIVLGNHGLIVGGGSVQEASDLADRLSALFGAVSRRGSEADLRTLDRLVKQGSYRLPHDPVAHNIATDADNLTIASLGSLYPDHVVFLGRGITVSEGGASGEGQDRAPMIVIPRAGVLISRSALAGADELARGLAEVVGRIPVAASVRCLSAADENELIAWDAEAYRLGIAANRAN
jgi:rhamnose utilization protein RhaD (predicted bifunctional aldolase and dehydrogenase)